MTPETLKAWRERLSLSQIAAASVLGCCRKTFQNWESGRTKIPGHLALALVAMERDIQANKTEQLTMTAYEVTAANRFFWQTLRVEAPSQTAAAKLFTDYLAAGDNQDAEKYEFELGLEYYEPDERAARKDYCYSFSDDAIEAIDGEASATVKTVNSGGNG